MPNPNYMIHKGAQGRKAGYGEDYVKCFSTGSNKEIRRRTKVMDMANWISTLKYQWAGNERERLMAVGVENSRMT